MARVIRLRQLGAEENPPARLHLFPHRHLGRAEFEIQDRYLSARLAALSATAAEGVVAGLEVQPAAFDGTAGAPAPDGILIRPGLAVAGGRRVLRLSAPLLLAWADLAPLAAEGDGFYLLALTLREDETVWGPAARPDAREQADPLRDERKDSFLLATLSPRLGPLPNPLDGVTADRFANDLAASLVGGSALERTAGAVPLALLALRGGALAWLNQAAGRWEAAPQAGTRLLLAQVRDALGRAAAAGGLEDAAAQAALRARFGRLPPAGQLPAILLRDPAGEAPSCPFFPEALEVLMAPLPQAAVAAVLAAEMPRAPLDLGARAGEGVVLLPVVADRDWRPDLMDRPRPDLALLEQLFAAYHRARTDWAALMAAQDAVGAGIADAAPAVLRRLAAALALAADSRPAGPRAQLGLADDEAFDEAIAALGDAGRFATWAASRSAALDALGDASWLRARVAARGEPLEPAPAAPADADALAAPVWDGTGPEAAPVRARATYRGWLQERPPVTYAPPAPGTLGALAELVIAECRLALVEQRQAHHHSRFEEHTGLLLLQRNHLDIMTTSLARLAGGVPSDGSGLEMAKLVPFISLKATAPAPEPPRSAAPAAAEGPALRMAALSTAAATPVASFARLAGSRAAGAVALQLDQQVAALRVEPQFKYQASDLGLASHIAQGRFVRDTAETGLNALRGAMRGYQLGDRPPVEAPAIEPGASDESRAYAGIPPLMRALVGDIATVELRTREIERIHLGFLSEVGLLRRRVATLREALAEARARLRAARSAAQVSEGDYLVAQRLVMEEAARVKAAAAERARILGSPLALLFVRRRQSRIALPLPDPLALRATAPGDLVPGCAARHEDPLPEGVEPMLDLVLDLPASAFAALAGLEGFLPRPARLLELGIAHEARMQVRSGLLQAAVAAAAGAVTGPAGPRLAPLLLQAQAAMAPLATTRLATAGSVAAAQRSAAGVLGVADLLAGPRSRLRDKAEWLREALESAGHCLLAALAALPPSVRFAWAEAAEADRLDLPRPERWPLFDIAGDAAFNATRSVTELVRFLHGQLAATAPPAAVAALGTYLRALLIEAAHGEPAGLLRGAVSAAPPAVRPGALLRLELNRLAVPGTRLQVLDAQRAVLAELRVDDHDGAGTLASVVALRPGVAAMAAGLAVVAVR